MVSKVTKKKGAKGGNNKRGRKNKEEEPQEEEYVVEKIETHRLNDDGEYEYYLKWQGYNSDANTWEPASNLQCEELIVAYHEKLDKEKSERKETSLKGSDAEDADDDDYQSIKDGDTTIRAARPGGKGLKRMYESSDDDDADSSVKKPSSSTPSEKSASRTRINNEIKKAARNRRLANSSRNYKEDTDDEDVATIGSDDDKEKPTKSGYSNRNSVSLNSEKSGSTKNFSLDVDTDDSLDAREKYSNKENNDSKVQPEFEIEEDDDDSVQESSINGSKKESTRDKFDEIISRTISSTATTKELSSSTVSSSSSLAKPNKQDLELAAEKVLKAGLLKDGKIHFLIKIEGIDEPQRYEAKDAHRLFPQAVIAYYQSKIQWAN